MIGVFIKTWDSMTDVSEFYHITNAAVSACCTGKSKSCVGYVWRYHGDPFDLYSNVQVVPINQFSINGELINNFLSIADASRFICGNGHGVGNIISCCKGKSHTAYGYVWRYMEDKFDKYSVSRNKSKIFVHKVNCYSLNKEYICTYDSVKDATIKLGLKDVSSIQASCTNHNKHARNFLWYYADDTSQPDKTKIININQI